MLKSVEYLQLLEEVGPEISGENFIFQQDTYPMYKAHRVTSYLRENRLEFLEWPVFCPDLSIIKKY